MTAFTLSAYSLFMANIITIRPDVAQLDATRMKRVSLPRAAHDPICILWLCVFKPLRYKSQTLLICGNLFFNKHCFGRFFFFVHSKILWHQVSLSYTLASLRKITCQCNMQSFCSRHSNLRCLSVFEHQK